jgi:hypothetical protein
LADLNVSERLKHAARVRAGLAIDHLGNRSAWPSFDTAIQVTHLHRVIARSDIEHIGSVRIGSPAAGAAQEEGLANCDADRFNSASATLLHTHAHKLVGTEPLEAAVRILDLDGAVCNVDDGGGVVLIGPTLSSTAQQHRLANREAHMYIFVLAGSMRVNFHQQVDERARVRNSYASAARMQTPPCGGT